MNSSILVLISWTFTFLKRESKNKNKKGHVESFKHLGNHEKGIRIAVVAVGLLWFYFERLEMPCWERISWTKTWRQLGSKLRGHSKASVACRQRRQVQRPWAGSGHFLEYVGGSVSVEGEVVLSEVHEIRDLSTGSQWYKAFRLCRNLKYPSHLLHPQKSKINKKYTDAWKALLKWLL